jgi:hypothetical protein
MVESVELLQGWENPYSRRQRPKVSGGLTLNRNLKELSPEELVSRFRRAALVVEGFCVAAEGIDSVTRAVIDDCRERVRSAHRQAKLAAGMELSHRD